MNLINLRKIVSNDIFLKLFVLFILLCSYGSVKAEILVNQAPWLKQGLDTLTYFDGKVIPSQDPNATYVSGLYFVDYGTWSYTHAGHADCNASCAARGEKCMVSSSPFDQGEKDEYNMYDIFYCSGEPYGEGVFGVVWTIEEFPNVDSDPDFSPAEEACNSKGATLHTSYSGDNYYWGGIALCQPCTSCGSGGTCINGPGGVDDSETKDPEEESPKSPQIEKKNSCGSGSGSWTSGGGAEEVEEEEDNFCDCSGHFDVSPETFSCADSLIPDVKIDWKVVSSNDLVTCEAYADDKDSFWKGDKNLEGSVGPIDVDLSNFKITYHQVKFYLDCFDTNHKLLWSGSDEIINDDTYIYDPTWGKPSILLTELDGTPLNTDGPNGETVAKDIKVSWSCPSEPYISADFWAITPDDDTVDLGKSMSGETNFSVGDGTTIFMLTCYGRGRCEGGGTSISISNIVPEPIITKFSVDPKIVQGYENLSTTIRWESENTEYCEYDNKRVETNGSDTKVFPDNDKINTIEKVELTCYDKKGRSVSTTTDVILKYPPRIIKFEAVPEEIKVGQSILLKWITENSNYCILKDSNSDELGGNTGNGDFNQEIKISEPGNHTYTLTCKNDSSYVDSKKVTVNVVGVPCEWVSNGVVTPEECTGDNPNEERVYGCKLNDSSCIPMDGFDSDNPPEDGCGSAGKCPPNCDWYMIKNPSDEECVEAEPNEPSIPQMSECILKTEDCLGAGKKPSDCITGSTGIDCLLNSEL